MGGNYHPNSVSDKLNLHRESMPEQIEARGAQYLYFIGARVYKEDAITGSRAHQSKSEALRVVLGNQLVLKRKAQTTSPKP